MRISRLGMMTVAVLTACNAGCYVDGRMQMPTWETMTAVWRRPKANQETAVAANQPPTVTMPSASQTPGRDTLIGGNMPNRPTNTFAGPGGSPAAQPGAAAAAFGATNASFAQSSPGQYPDTGKQAIQAYGATGGNPASPASYDNYSPRFNGGGYASGGPYDSPVTNNPYVQSGPYDSGSRGGERRSAPNDSYSERSTAPANRGEYYSRGGADPYADDYSSQRFADRGGAAPTSGPRGGDSLADRPASRDYLPSDARTARRDGPVVSSDTGYRPGETGYSPPSAQDYARAVNTEQPTYNGSGSPNGQPAQGNAAPRNDSQWSPGGTSRYQPRTGVSDAATINPYARDNGSSGYSQSPHATAVRDSVPPPRDSHRGPTSGSYSDPYVPEAPATRYDDAGRYDGMQ